MNYRYMRSLFYSIVPSRIFDIGVTGVAIEPGVLIQEPLGVLGDNRLLAAGEHVSFVKATLFLRAGVLGLLTGVFGDSNIVMI